MRECLSSKKKKRKNSNELVDLREKNNYTKQNICIKVLCILIIASGIIIDIVTVEI